MRVLVYQMGKVGSSTVMRALQGAGIVAGRGYPENLHSIDVQSFDAIISMVRDPIARNISQYWEQGGGKFDHFLKNFLHHYPVYWFDKHFYPHFWIDVYQGEFDHEKGWKMFGNILIIRTESLSFGLASALTELVGAREYKVEHRAEGWERFVHIHGAGYAEFMKQVKFTEAFLAHIYDSKYARHFYSEEEIEKMKERWRK